jgi:SET family sugar efflux transporter-like MFS transporter
MAALRMISSVSWTIGPALGAALVWQWHFEGVYFGAALMALCALLVVLVGGLRPTPIEVSSSAVDTKSWRSIWPAALALTLFNTAMFAGSNAMSVSTVSVLGGSSGDVGLVFSLCAAIEVVVMAAFVIWPAKQARRPILVLGFALFAFGFALILLLPGLATVYWAQIPRGIAIGIVHVVGMLYVQQSMPQQAGGASAVFSNALNGALLLSGIGTGTWAAAFGYFSLFGLCAVLAVIGGLLFAVSRYPTPSSNPRPAGDAPSAS